ncbi:hypothetical protein GCM10010156_51660 [Planobispora rosea]|uniref:Toxin-antitoxin system HicB family antitoxin n=1 Tax=Planobispora rosea TaxID=35762 RepID=A0A8J3S7S9_PLARO|nr:hypothetical protein [Planobispora rosea]GGS86776.1 hypothetical protein GCM10010156_51660 [Planobispora rosea]GIH88320.1 hypothetical protein Pro02_67280 [Planobispora rosea]
MSGSKRGPDPKWGPVKQHPLRVPVELLGDIKTLAQQRGCSVNEYIVRVLAREHDFVLAPPPRTATQDPLPLIEGRQGAAA